MQRLRALPGRSRLCEFSEDRLRIDASGTLRRRRFEFPDLRPDLVARAERGVERLAGEFGPAGFRFRDLLVHPGLDLVGRLVEHGAERPDHNPGSAEPTPT